MREHAPVIQSMKISDVRTQLNTLVKQVYRHETRVVVEKSGIPVAVLVSTNDFERLNQLDRERAQRFTIVDELRAAFQDTPSEELEREAGRAIAEVRAERETEREPAAASRP